MTRRVLFVTLHAGAAMGQQHHEAAMLRALRRNGEGRTLIRSITVGPLSDRAEEARRIPLGIFEKLPSWLCRSVADWFYQPEDLVHRLDLRCPPSRSREILTVHDLPPLRFPDEGSLPRHAATSVRRSACVICPSTFAAEEVEQFFRPRRVYVIPNGVCLEAVEPLASEELQALGIRTPFVLHAGGATERKNLRTLVAAWSAVAGGFPYHELVLCGPPDSRRDDLLRNATRARFVGHLTHGRVQQLIRSADAVVVPSTYEGFGLPALEGMAAGTPVIAADAGALREVCEDAALLVPPSQDGIAAGMEEILRDGPEARRLRLAGPERAAGFTWDRAAQATLEVYESAG